MSSEALKNAVRQYLASHYMFVDEEWLDGCVEYLSEDSGSNLSETEIKNLAKEQWLLNDLNTVCPGCLPPNLKNQQRTVLNGRFVLQINAAVDIGTPAYQQYLKLQKVNMENVEATTNFEEKIPSHRMTKLHLTDGAQEISAVEYKPMRNLTCDIPPGCKVLIKGPVECRRGVLLLTESSIELLGGEVQELAYTNSLAGLLSRKLGVTIPPGTESNATINHPQNTNISATHIEIPAAVNHRTEVLTSNHRTEAPTTNHRIEPTTNHRCNPTQPVTIHQPTTFADDDIDIDQIAVLEAQLTDNKTKRSLDSNLSNPEKKIKIDTVNNPDDYPDENDLFLEDEDYLKELEAELESNTAPCVQESLVRISAEPFVYIKQIQDMSDKEKAGKVFKVKGQIMTLLSKLSVSKEEWSLKCTIVDGTGRLDVEFTSDVLSKLVGITPQEMNLMKKQMATKPELKEKAFSAIKKARDKLQVLYCIIEITILEVPKITDYKPFDCMHVERLKQRELL